MSDIMNVRKPWEALGDGDPGQADYCLQDGVIYNWSDSNIQYERAWWLTPAGSPINDGDHVRNLLRDRPFDPDWLTRGTPVKPVSPRKARQHD